MILLNYNNNIIISIITIDSIRNRVFKIVAVLHDGLLKRVIVTRIKLLRSNSTKEKKGYLLDDHISIQKRRRSLL